MKARKEYISKYADKHLKRSNLVIRIAVLIMVLTVLYDSFMFNIPLYYILFLAAGMLIGRIFFFSHHVEFDQNKVQLKLRTNKWALFFLVLLLIGRFIVGPSVLNTLHFVRPSDAILLFFIGIYRIKWQVIVKQIDEIFYRFLQNLNQTN